MTKPVVVAPVEVKSAWASKINWTQGVSAIAMGLAFFTGDKLNMSPETQAALVVVIGWVTNAVTIVIKTWFTLTVTPASIDMAAITKE